MNCYDLLKEYNATNKDDDTIPTFKIVSMSVSCASSTLYKNESCITFVNSRTNELYTYLFHEIIAYLQSGRFCISNLSKLKRECEKFDSFVEEDCNRNLPTQIVKDIGLYIMTGALTKMIEHADDFGVIQYSMGVHDGVLGLLKQLNIPVEGKFFANINEGD